MKGCILQDLSFMTCLIYKTILKVSFAEMIKQITDIIFACADFYTGNELPSFTD
jgi:hypothetical protein